jgi:hypothetical protein
MRIHFFVFEKSASCQEYDGIAEHRRGEPSTSIRFVVPQKEETKMPDPNCAHCNGAQHCYKQAMQQQMPPYEAIRTALLTGITVGTTDLADAPTCKECQDAIEKIRSGIERAAEMIGDKVGARGSARVEHPAGEE